MALEACEASVDAKHTFPGNEQTGMPEVYI